ncbi:unnamed protein product [Boreogadus saida]
MNEKRADVLEVCSSELGECWSCDGSRLGMDPRPQLHGLTEAPRWAVTGSIPTTPPRPADDAALQPFTAVPRAPRTFQTPSEPGDPAASGPLPRTSHSRTQYSASPTLSSSSSAPFTAPLDDQRCVYVFVLRKRAVAQPLEPVWWTSSLQARSLQPQRHSVFHVRDRARLQPFMSSPLFQTEDPEKSPFQILLSY